MPPLVLAGVPPGLVWLASYPKSGNTWTRILLSHLLADSDSPQDINDLSVRSSTAISFSALEDFSLLDGSLLHAEEIERLRPLFHDADAAETIGGGFVKTHDAYTRLPDGTPLLGRAGRAALYIVRDPRDVVVSYAYFIHEDIEGIIATLNNPTGCLIASPQQFRQRLLDWSGHVKSWLDQRDLPVHVMRYEDLLVDTVGTFSRALDFLGIVADSRQIERAVRHSSFAELQRQEQERGFLEFGVPTPFFRKGRVGDWREALTPAQVRAIEGAHGETMDRLGYQREYAT
jgi:aryl sulfotransferase